MWRRTLNTSPEAYVTAPALSVFFYVIFAGQSLDLADLRPEDTARTKIEATILGAANASRRIY